MLVRKSPSRRPFRHLPKDVFHRHPYIVEAYFIYLRHPAGQRTDGYAGAACFDYKKRNTARRTVVGRLRANRAQQVRGRLGVVDKEFDAIQHILVVCPTGQHPHAIRDPAKMGFRNSRTENGRSCRDTRQQLTFLFFGAASKEDEGAQDAR